MNTEKALVDQLKSDRKATAENVLNFDFKKKRIRILSNAKDIKENSNGIIYWMSREMRVQDNWSFLFAQKLALKNKVPLHVFFFLVPNFLRASGRHYKFLIKGLEEVSIECKKLMIPFHLYSGAVDEHLPEIVTRNNIGGVVCDFSPLRISTAWTDSVKEKLPSDVPLCQVDGHNIVPCWEASNKQEYAARTIRKKISSQLDVFLTSFPPVIEHPYSKDLDVQKFDWDEALSKCAIDSESEQNNLPSWLKPGYTAGIEMLDSFCKSRLKIFAEKRNDPTVNALSNLSPWFHFGQIAPQRCILQVNKYKEKYRPGVNAYMEEAIIRRELSDNFCFYNPNYDNFNGITDWAKITLNNHRKDKRSFVYSQEKFEKAETHDDLWNSAQIELVKDGKIHGFMRMYWAKKILEWSESPEEAIRIAIYLNDHYSMDGRDPNGYVGILWSICGIHDQGWAERVVFGKVRYMNYAGCKKKFNVNAYVAKWGGKEHKYTGEKHSPENKTSPKKKLKTK